MDDAGQPPETPATPELPDRGSHRAPGRGVKRRSVLGAGAAALGIAGLGIGAAEYEGSGSGTGNGNGNDGKQPVAASETHRATAGASPTPTPEEDLPGDPNWQISSVGEPDAIVGYADQVSVLPGQQVGLYVSTTSLSYQVMAFRVGWYGGAQARLVWQSETLPGSAQADPQFEETTRTISTQWNKSLTLDTTGWTEGAYLIRLDAANGHQRYVPLIVRSTSAKDKVLIMHATATWQAYNLWGNYNLYQGADGAYSTRSYVVTFDRPYDDNGAEKFLVYEQAAVVLAEKLGLPLAYTTGMDVHNDPGVLTGATALFSLGHDEYWTPQQRQYVTAARDAGTNIAFLGANTCFRRVRFDSTTLGANRTVMCYKTDYQLDPLYGSDDTLVTTDFRADPAPDPESSMTGVLYESYPTDAPYVVTSADHWLFEGTGVQNGDSFDHLVGTEYDRVTPGYSFPRPLEIVAHSPLVCNGTDSHSDSAYYTVASGAGVFASGTMRWVEGLLAGTPLGGDEDGMDATTGAFVTQVTTNLMQAFAKGPAGTHMPAPQDNVDAIYD
jgi:hypothetical protein